MDIKNLIIGALVGLTTLFGGLYVVGTPQEAPAPVPAPDRNLGALAGPDIPSPYLRWGNVLRWSANTSSLNAASTTVCSLQGPSATSTLQLGSGVRLDVSTTTSHSILAYRASTPDTATTLLFAAGSFSANTQNAVAATTTTDNFVFAPNQYLVIKMTGGTGTYSPTGSCSASWTAL